MVAFDDYTCPEPELEQRIAEIHALQNEEHISEEFARILIGALDLTSLEGTDTDRRIAEICNKAVGRPEKGIPPVAAVCFYPNFIRTAKKVLAGTGIRVAAVAGAFPSGQTSGKLRLMEVSYAVDEGADEIDTVMQRGKLLDGEYNYLLDELAEMKHICGNVHLKVILETGELKTPDNIRKAAEIALNAGADFIKTSTGKTSPAATETAFLVMADTLQEYCRKTGSVKGIKPAGGISEPKQALRYATILSHIMGKEWINPATFRIGASRLLDNLIATL